MKSISNKKREITPKVRKPELSFLYRTRHLVMFYISTKYDQNNPKGIQVSERTRIHIMANSTDPDQLASSEAN